MTLRLSPLVRVLAALLAVVGLTAAPLRAFPPCEMQARVAAEHDVHAEHNVHAAHDAHAAHAMHMSGLAPQSDETPSPNAEHPGPCLDLTHCAVVGWTPVGTRLPQGLVQVTRRIAEPDARWSSVGRSIDTPPPKRA